MRDLSPPGLRSMGPRQLATRRTPGVDGSIGVPDGAFS